MVIGTQVASGAILVPKSHQPNQLSREQLQVIPFSVTVSPSAMILPEGILQLFPGDYENYNHNDEKGVEEDEEEVEKKKEIDHKEEEEEGEEMCKRDRDSCQCLS